MWSACTSVFCRRTYENQYKIELVDFLVTNKTTKRLDGVGLMLWLTSTIICACRVIFCIGGAAQIGPTVFWDSYIWYCLWHSLPGSLPWSLPGGIRPSMVFPRSIQCGRFQAHPYRWVLGKVCIYDVGHILPSSLDKGNLRKFVFGHWIQFLTGKSL